MNFWMFATVASALCAHILRIDPLLSTFCKNEAPIQTFRTHL